MLVWQILWDILLTTSLFLYKVVMICWHDFYIELISPKILQNNSSHLKHAFVLHYCETIQKFCIKHCWLSLTKWFGTFQLQNLRLSHPGTKLYWNQLISILIIHAGIPMGRWKQKSFPQSSCKRITRWLWRHGWSSLR